MNASVALFLLILAQTPAIPPAATPADETIPQESDVIRDRIRQCKKTLADAKIGTDRLGGQHAVLCVWRPSEPGDTRLIRVQGGMSRTPGFSVRMVKQNGVNTLYEVTRPSGCLVLAIKTNVLDGRTVVTAGKNRRHRSVRFVGRTTGAVYAPYGEALKRPEFVAAGREYLVALADRAGERLDRREVKSLADPDLLVTEIVPERVLIALMVIEHVDPDDFDRLGERAMTEMVLAMVAANGEDSFAYSFSWAGAGGLAQFIGSTYRLTQARYPAAALLPDFMAGMRDHENAVMAQYCLADWSLTKLPTDVYRRLADGNHEEDLGAWLAAAYNGGESRATAVYLNNPRDWEKAGHGLRRETVRYVREFRLVYRWLFTEPPSAPASP